MACRVTVKNKKGDILKKDLTEAEFKKYLAKGGLLDLAKEEGVNIDLNFMRDFVKPGVKETVAQTINRTTEGRPKGKKVVVNDWQQFKERLIERAKAFREGQLEGKKAEREKSKAELKATKEKAASKLSQVKETAKEKLDTALESIRERNRAEKDIIGGLRDEIKIQLERSGVDVFKGKNIKGSTALRMFKVINESNSPLQLLNAIDYVEKAIQDVDYGNKLNQSRELAKSAVKLSAELPVNLRNSILELAGSEPKELDQVNNFNEVMSKVVKSLKTAGAEKINAEELSSLAKAIKKSNLSAKIERLQRLNPDSNINFSDSISEMENAYNELNALNKKRFESSGEAFNDETAEGEPKDKRSNLVALNKDLTLELIFSDTKGLDAKKKALVEAMQKIDVNRLSNKELTFLNHSIYNYLENGKFDGVGAYIALEYKSQKAAETVNMKVAKEGSLKVNALADALQSTRTLPTKIQAVTLDENTAARVRILTGLAEHIKQYGAKNGFRSNLAKTMDQLVDVAKKTGVIESFESQIKIGAVNEIVQAKSKLSPEERAEEFEARKRVMVRSIANGKAEMAVDAEYKARNEKYIEVVEQVYEKYVKDSKTPEELISKLTDGEKAVRDLMLGKYAQLKPDLIDISEIYRNKEWDDIDAYFPRSYIRPFGGRKTNDREQLSQILDIANDSGGAPGLEKEVSTAFSDRTIIGDGLPENAMINYDSFSVFQNEYSRQLYDVKTAESRAYMAHFLSGKYLMDMVNGDKVLFRYYQNAFIQRIMNEKMGLKSLTDSNDSIATLRDIDKTVRNIGVRGALGGLGIPAVKQFAPTIASVQMNTIQNPELLYSSWREAWFTEVDVVKKLISQSPVYARHEQEAQFINSNIEAKDIRAMTNSFRKGLKWWDAKCDKIFMKALKQGDQSSASIAFTTYYKQSLLQQGIYKNVSDINIKKEAENPNEVAMSYAEQMTSTTLNINESVDKAKKQIGGWWMPFLSFAVNSKQNSLVNWGKLTTNRGLLSKEQQWNAAKRLGAQVAEAISINMTSAGLRNFFIYSSSNILSIYAGSQIKDDKEKLRIQELIDEYSTGYMEKTWENAWHYTISDIVTGQIAENYSRPLTSAIYENIFNSARVSLGYEKKKFKTEWRPNDQFKILGVYAIPIINGMTALDNFSEYMQPNNAFLKQKYGYIDINQTVQIPLDKKDLEKPNWLTNPMGAVALANAMATFGGAAQEISAMTRRVPQILSKVEMKEFGKNRYPESWLEPLDGNMYNYSKLQDAYASFRIEGDPTEYYMTPQMLSEWDDYRHKQYKETYGRFMQSAAEDLLTVKPTQEQLKKRIPGVIVPQDITKYKYAEDIVNPQIVDWANGMAYKFIVEKYAGKLKTKEQLEDEVKKK